MIFYMLILQAEYAEIVKKKLGQVVSDPVDIADIDVSSLATYDGFIVGAPTWHTGNVPLVSLQQLATDVCH